MLVLGEFLLGAEDALDFFFRGEVVVLEILGQSGLFFLRHGSCGEQFHADSLLLNLGIAQGGQKGLFRFRVQLKQIEQLLEHPLHHSLAVQLHCFLGTVALHHALEGFGDFGERVRIFLRGRRITPCSRVRGRGGGGGTGFIRCRDDGRRGDGGPCLQFSHMLLKLAGRAILPGKQSGKNKA